MRNSDDDPPPPPPPEDDEDDPSSHISQEIDNNDEDISVASSQASVGSQASSQQRSRTGPDDEVKLQHDSANRHIASLRCTVLALLVIVGICVTVGTYLFLKAQQQNASQTTFTLFTVSMQDTSAEKLLNTQQALRGLGQVITNQALLRKQVFPNVTITDMELHGHHALQQSGLESLVMVPLVWDREAWIQYSTQNQGWIETSRTLAMQAGWGASSSYQSGSIPNDIYTIVNGTITSSLQPPYLPNWLTSPPPINPNDINFDMLQLPWMLRLSQAMMVVGEGILFSEVLDFTELSQLSLTPQDHLLYHSVDGDGVVSTDAAAHEIAYDRPHAAVMSALYNTRKASADNIVGLLVGLVPWDLYLTDLLPEGVSGSTAVLQNSCDQWFTYRLDGNAATYLGPGDLHSDRSDRLEATIPLTFANNTDVAGHCQYSLLIYSTSSYSTVSSNTPLAFTLIVAAIFAALIIVFLVYDMFVRRRNNKLVDAALRSHAILSSLFPTNVRARLFAAEKESTLLDHAPERKTTLKGFLDTETMSADFDDDVMEGRPIADFFPETSVLFADIVGFTAWSSVREPAQVFTLLETLFRAFDEIAKRRRVFKVETVGDCYVAATGLPEPRRDHAVAMARFAWECLQKMYVLTKKLEIALGPDTGDLDLRVGIHSGPVTAGVLRGERSRFQLFGDTMNTASRMESNGVRGRIHVSQDTADLLIAAGKSSWLSVRDEKVIAKGKGEMQTFWLALGATSTKASSEGKEGSRQGSDLDAAEKNLPVSPTPVDASRIQNEKTNRLIEWNADVMARLLKQIVARRQFVQKALKVKEDADESKLDTESHMVIEEVKEIITLPEEDHHTQMKNADSVELDPAVLDQLHDYVANIAAMYNENPFHNFDHASHVTMSVTKLLSRIVAPSELEYNEAGGRTLHDHTYGITSDPLTQFACVLSALIHDVDHPGVPNVQLIKEDTLMAKNYQNKSIAEQNSLDLAWNLLMDASYDQLRHTIYTTQSELIRFRQLLVNSVMATDIVDKELKTLRNERWAKAFSESAKDDDTRDAVNRKATIVIEHLIQASDVAHTMQHWHIYRKWNERFFMECYNAYTAGRADKNPADSWYEGELGFYDFYIIPLAKKLKECGVFGVSSDEYLNYAVRNRKEWEERGREVVGEMVSKVERSL